MLMDEDCVADELAGGENAQGWTHFSEVMPNWRWYQQCLSVAMGFGRGGLGIGMAALRTDLWLAGRTDWFKVGREIVCAGLVA